MIPILIALVYCENDDYSRPLEEKISDMRKKLPWGNAERKKRK
jgi:hypothetical protein